MYRRKPGKVPFVAYMLPGVQWFSPLLETFCCRRWIKWAVNIGTKDVVEVDEGEIFVYHEMPDEDG